MATVVDKTADGIIYRSEKSYPIPDLDVLSLLFGTPTTAKAPNTTPTTFSTNNTPSHRLRTQPSQTRYSPPRLSRRPKSNPNHIARPPPNPSHLSRPPQPLWYRRPWPRKRRVLRHLDRPLPPPCPRAWNHRCRWYLLRCVCGKHGQRTSQATPRCQLEDYCHLSSYPRDYDKSCRGRGVGSGWRRARTAYE